MKRLLTYVILAGLAVMALSPLVRASVEPDYVPPCYYTTPPYDECVYSMSCLYCFFVYGNDDNPDRIRVRWYRDWYCEGDNSSGTETFYQYQCDLYWICQQSMPGAGDLFPCT